MKKKNLIIIVMIVILLILLGGGIAFAYFFTDMFKSDKEMFFKYAVENNEIFDLLKDEKLEKYGEKQQSTAYTSNGSIKINNFHISDLDENLANVLNGSSITFTSSTDHANNYTHKNINLNYSNTESLTLEYANIQDYYGIKINDVVNKFIAIENNNLKTFATTIGLDAETIEEIPDKIDFDNMSSLNLFTDEEISQLKSTYQSILIENLTDDMFSKSETTENDIYTLTLTKSQIENIICKMLEQLKDDEIIMNKIKQIIIENIEYSETEADETITDIKENIQEYIDNLNNNIADSTDEITENSNIVINIYVKDKKLVKTELLIDGDNLSVLKNSNGFSIEYIEDGETSSSSINLEKIESTDTLEYKVSASSEGNQIFNLDINFSGLSTLEQVQEGFTFKLSSSDDLENYAGYTYSNTKNFNIGGITQDVTIDDMLSLNTAPNMESIQSLFNQIGTRLDDVHTAHMTNVGLIENSDEDETSDSGYISSENIVNMSNEITRDPFIYYVPAVIPLGAITGIQSSSSQATTIATSATLVGTTIISLNNSGLLSSNQSEGNIKIAKETVFIDLDQVITEYYSATYASNTPYDGTMMDYIKQNWVSSDETLYTVNENVVTIVGTDITGEVQESGNIVWSDETDE